MRRTGAHPARRRARTARSFLLLGPLLLGACEGAAEPAIVVCAAASTAPALEENAGRYERETGRRVVVNAAASSVLARQIEAGAPADLFLSASTEWMDHVESRGLIRAGSRRDLLANRLVLVAPRGAGLVVEMRPGFDLAAACPGRIAAGDPGHVPAGRYAEQALRHLGWWEEVRPRLLAAPDVRAALRLVERGEAAAGIVYASDARSASGVEIVAEFPASSHDSVRYPLAICAGARPHADDLAAWLRAPEAAAVFLKHGFELAE